MVSIHAPAWGATYAVNVRHAANAFQSTLPHGERPTDPGGVPIAQEFQSTLPHGERRERLVFQYP